MAFAVKELMVNVFPSHGGMQEGSIVKAAGPAQCGSCTSCTSCTGCTGCSNCSSCTGCTNCSNCSNCTRCTSCTSGTCFFTFSAGNDLLRSMSRVVVRAEDLGILKQQLRQALLGGIEAEPVLS